MSERTESSWQVKIAPQAQKTIRRMPRPERERILHSIKELQEGPYETKHVKPLSGRSEWSLRVGERRVLLRVDHGAKVIVAVEVGPQGDVYK